MNDRFQYMSDADLEGVLEGLDTSRMFPPTPDVAARVSDRLRAGEPADATAPASIMATRRWIAIAATIAVLVLGAAVLAIPTSRDTVAGWFGLRSVSIVQVTVTPELPATPFRLGLGNPTPLHEAQRWVRFDILVPELERLGPPDETYFDNSLPGGQVALVYQGQDDDLPQSTTGIGLLFTQFEADLNVGAFAKGVPEGATIEQVTVNGGPGLWIEGNLHTFYYTDRNGNPGDEHFRLAGNVLVWEVDDVTYRIESSLPRDEVFQIAESLVPFEAGVE